jgi:hypothetical protein
MLAGPENPQYQYKKDDVGINHFGDAKRLVEGYYPQI